MKAIETTATLTNTGQLTLDQPLTLPQHSRVRIIVLIPEDESQPLDSGEDELEEDPNSTPTEDIIKGIQQGFQEALSGQTIPLSELWEGIDAE